jgi:hypothetical protein
MNDMREHLSSDDLAAYIDGILPAAEQTRADEHLADCDDCQTELIALSRVLRSKPSRRRLFIPAAIAATAAAVAVLWITTPWDYPNYREPAVSATPAPIGVAPHGPTTGPVRLVWTRVPHAERYRLTVFDSSGAVVWTSQTKDTSLSVAGLRARVRYFWQVEAETGFDRWIRSDVVEFVIRP